jgi:hypothetical protein
MKTLFLFLAISVTQSTGDWVLNTVHYPSLEACVAAAKEGLTTPLECVQVNKVAIEGNCSDVPMPTATVIEKADDGTDQVFNDLGVKEGFLCPGRDDKFFFRESRTIAADFPTCWQTIMRRVSFCDDPPADPDIAEAPPIDPEFVEGGDGPGPGPKDAVTVDKKAP